MRWLPSLFLLLVQPGISLAINVSIFPLQGEFRYVENELKEHSIKTLSPVGVAFLFDRYQLGLEKVSWRSESGTSVVGFTEKYEELNSTHLYEIDKYTQYVSFLAGVGLGRYEVKVTNTFNGVSTQTESGPVGFLTGIASIQVMYEFIHLAADLRLLMAKDLQPQPTPTMNLRVGLIF